MTKSPKLLDEELDDPIARQATLRKVRMKILSPVNLLLFLYFALEVVDIEGWKMSFEFIIAFTVVIRLFQTEKGKSKHIYDISKNKKSLKIYSVDALNKRIIIDISLDEIKKVEVKEKKFGIFRNELKIYLSKSVKTFLYNGENITELVNDFR